MNTLTSLATALPESQPQEAGARLLLFGIRQMGAHGLNDAAAAHAFVTGFGKDFRRPLVLLRALMAEMSSVSAGPIQIAPWCCQRMTGAEATLLDVIALVRTDARRARYLLADLLGVRSANGVLATARALSNAFNDLALPLDREA
jgi:hypothetical protein